MTTFQESFRPRKIQYAGCSPMPARSPLSAPKARARAPPSKGISKKFSYSPGHCIPSSKGGSLRW